MQRNRRPTVASYSIAAKAILDAAHAQAPNDNRVGQTSAASEPYHPGKLIEQVTEQLACLDLKGAYQLLREGISATTDDGRRRQLISDGSAVLCGFSELIKRADIARRIVRYLREMVDAEPNYAEIHNGLGLACASLGTLTASRDDLKDAIAAYDTARNLNRANRKSYSDPFRWRVAINKAVALQHIAYYEDAPEKRKKMLLRAEGILQSVLRKLSQIDKGLTRVDRLRSNEALGIILSFQNKFDEGLKYFETSYNIAKENGSTNIDRARILNDIGAVYLAMFAIDKQPEHIEKAINKYKLSLKSLSKIDTPYEWCHAQRNCGEALLLKFKEIIKEGADLCDAIARLEGAREVCSVQLSPALRRDISISLGNAIKDAKIYLSPEDQESILSGLPLLYYRISCDGVEISIIYDKMSRTIESFDHSNSVGFVGIRDDILNIIRDNVALPAERRERAIARIPDVPESQIDALSAVLADHIAAAVLGEEEVVANDRGVEGASTPRIPRTWDEAKAEVPGLMKWSDVKADHSGLTVIDYLGNCEHGYGLWTDRPPGLPRKSLRDLDPVAHRDLYKWLAENDPKTGIKNEIPKHLNLPTKSEVVRAEMEGGQETIRFARRVMRRLERKKANQSQSL